MNTVKKGSFLIFPLLLIFQAGGIFGILYGFFLYGQINSSDRLETLVLSAEEYSAVKRGNDEVFFGGTMYDVKEIDFRTDEVELLAYRDWSETELMDLVAGVFGNSSSGQSVPNVPFMKIISLLYLPVFFQLPDKASGPDRLIFAEFSQKITSGFHFIFSPPPDRF